MSALGNPGPQDDYYFSGIESGWLASRFENDYGRFPYIGARQRLEAMQKEKSLVRRVVEAVLMRARIKSLVGYVTEKIIGWKPSQGSDPNKLAEDLIKVFDEERNKQAITKYLADTQKGCRERRRYFDAVGIAVPNGIRLSQANQASLHDEMIVVCGHLVHRDALAQYNGLFSQSVSKLPGEWLLGDFPPMGMVDGNDRFKGKVICLTMEKQFGSIFQQYLPFRKDIGWYPYCRVTGFFKEPGLGQSAPSLDMVMAEFRRPKQYQEEGSSYVSFLEGELKHPVYFASRSNLLCASYVLPLLAKGSSIENFTAPPPEKTILKQYMAAAGADLPRALVSWYANI